MLCWCCDGGAVRLAAKRDANEAAIVDALIAHGCTVTRLSQAGVPDLLVGHFQDHRRRWALLEVKSGTNRLTPDQRAFMEYHSGCPAYVVRTPQDALDVLQVGVVSGVA